MTELAQLSEKKLPDILFVMRGGYRSRILNKRGSRKLREGHFSNILAWLLDPEGDHGFGAQILKALLKAAGLPHPAESLVQIAREDNFPGRAQRRSADLVLRFDSAPVVAIEVKTESGKEVPSQLEDYMKHWVIDSGGYVILLCPQDVTCLSDEMQETLARYSAMKQVTWLHFLETARACEHPKNASEVGEAVLQSLWNHFLRGGGPMKQVTWEYTEGTRSLKSLLAMIRAAVKSEGLARQARKNVYEDDEDPWLGFYAESSPELWVYYGIRMDEPHKVTFCWGNHDDPETYASRAAKLKQKVPGSETPHEGEWHWPLDLESAEVHFFARNVEDQLRILKDHLHKAIEHVREVS